jgi:hypothetical protein
MGYVERRNAQVTVLTRVGAALTQASRSSLRRDPDLAQGSVVELASTATEVTRP